MQSESFAKVSRAEQQRFGLPESFKTFGPFPFAGMNRQASRMAIGDPEAFWMENYIKVGDGNLRAVPDKGPPLYTLPDDDDRTLINFAWFNIGLFDYCMLFFDDGSAIQVDTVGGTIDVAASGFYVADGPYPATVGWGSVYLLISNNNTQSDYWAWDGSVLYGAGGVSPQVTMLSGGSNYVATPTITVFGGHGSGVVLVPQIQNGSIVGLTVSDPGSGYVPGDVVQVLFSGGGSDSSAQLTAVLETSSVNQIVVLSGGTGYSSAPTVTITGGGGAGAAATATILAGAVVSVTVTNGGSGYTSAPTIGFTGGGGSGAAAASTLVPVGIASVTVDDGGTNYFGVPAITFRGGFGGGATATAIMSGPGPIASIKVDDGGGGSGYTALPNVTITDGGSGTGATAIVSQISGGVVQAIEVVNPGSGYTSPTVTIDPPSSGTTATATAAIGAGSIVSVTVNLPGHGYTDAPAVIVQAGLNSAAAATLSLMPFGVSGSSIETYQSQVWVQDPYQPGSGAPPVGGVRQSSAPGSISDFATSDGGLQETVTDRFLRRHLTAIRQSNGFLYPFGDSSVNVISNVQVQGSPPTKTLTSQNTDPQTATHWRDTLQDLSRTILFTNPFGVFGLFGGAVTKISAKMDLVFAEARFPATENPSLADGVPVTPSAAVAHLFNRKLYLVLMNIRDPFTGTYRNAMLTWNEQDWSVVSQSIDLTYIGTRTNNSQLFAWGTDGRALYPLMNVPSEDISKIFCSKLYGAQQPYMTQGARMLYVQAENFAVPTQAPLITFTVDTEYASFPAPAPPTLAGMPPSTLPANATAPVSSSPLLMAPTGDVPGQQLGFTLTSVAADFGLYNVQMASEDVGVFFG